MIVSEAGVPTQHASRYLQQLSKHWSHKFDVTYDETASTIPFDENRKAELSAEPDRLTIRLSVPDEETRIRMQKVIEDHLNRFAFRETLEYRWREA
ncbi:DUF2218 domain-containing protein [Microvirga subterranea]|uniref:DUF2218 domain-containing protein n=1 Tax=Microvirga subterranea TaxID=186651 RepID=A0A370HI30_9HYPH|nr:DUF2218 domain-containing protein [Microvirga subterranea]RDI57312.1 hypothetical protein DES45_107230 [Microvirga subterranea]